MQQVHIRNNDFLNGDLGWCFLAFIVRRTGVEDFDAVVALNFGGLVDTTNAFLPLLNADGGRVVMISSGSAPNFVEKCSEAVQVSLLRPRAVSCTSSHLQSGLFLTSYWLWFSRPSSSTPTSLLKKRLSSWRVSARLAKRSTLREPRRRKHLRPPTKRSRWAVLGMQFVASCGTWLGTRCDFGCRHGRHL